MKEEKSFLKKQWDSQDDFHCSNEIKKKREVKWHIDSHGYVSLFFFYPNLSPFNNNNKLNDLKKLIFILFL